MTDGAGTSQAPFRVGDFEARPATNELHGPAGTVRLPPMQMALLARLARAAGEPVTRETLIADVWERRGVTDEVLSRAIAELRQALGDDARHPRYLETLPKIGYRLRRPAAQPQAADTRVTAATPRCRGWRPGSGWPTAAIVAVFAGLLAYPWLTGKRDAADRLTAQLAWAQALASAVEAEVAPRFAPDGRSIAFAVTAGERSHIVVLDRSSSTSRTIERAGGVAFSPVFLPDGERIAYWFRTPSDCGIAEHRLADGRERTLVPCSERPQPRFDVSPDGGSIVFASRAPTRPARLVLFDVARQTARPLTSPEPGEGDDTHPRFARDGKRIAFFRGSDSHRQLFVAALDDDAKAVAATPHGGLTYGAAWLSAETLLVSADWSGFRALQRVDLATGHAELVGARGARYPDVDRHGDIVYESASYRANLWPIPLDAQAAGAAMWPSTRYTNQPAVSPDGTRVAFVSNRDGNAALYVAPFDGSPRRLAPGDTRVFLRPHWSRDGRAIYAIASRGDRVQAQAVRIDPKSGESAALPFALPGVWDVSELDDGTLIVAESYEHAARLYRAPPGTTSLERMPLPVVSQVVTSGALIAFTQPQLPGITVCAHPALDCLRLDVPVGDANRFDWTLTARALWYRDGDALVRVDLATRRETSRLRLDHAAAAGGLAVSADERRGLVVREDAPEIDLMLAPR